jgi:carboxypeptidase PM20D1
MDILKPVFIWKISKNPEDNARISSTYAITVIEASNVQNAVSSDASFLIDARILPNETVCDIKNYINKIVAKTLPDENVKIEYLSKMEPSVSKNQNKDEYEKLSKIIKKIYPDIKVSPYLTLGATDAREYNEISDNTFRFLPCILKPEEAALMHSDNEKISIKNWQRMITFYKEYILSK